MNRLSAALAMAGLACACAAQAQGETTMDPKVTEKGTGEFCSTSAPALLATRGALKDGGAAVQPLADLLAQRFGATAKAEPAGRALPAGPYILAGLSGERSALRDLVARVREKLPKQGLGEEGYVLDVTPERILLAADKPAGLFRGATALAEMAGVSGDGLAIPAGTTADWPEMAWRGMHVSAETHASMPALEAIITRYGPALRINKLLIEVNYGFTFRSHPEMASADGLTPDDCRRLAGLARQHFIEIIPQINCLGHQSWSKTTARLLTAHPEFDETPDLPADNPGIYCRSWCPSNPDVVKLVGDLMDEVINAFGSKWFHCGMDEVFILGKCPRCKGKDNAALFAKAVNDLHAHLAKRRVGMMIWGDRLLDAKQVGYGEWESSANGTAPAIKLVPRDIVLCDWHYETPADFPSVKLLQEAGFRVWPSGWNRVKNARLLAGCALRNAGPNMAGYMATTWEGAEAVARDLGSAAAPPADPKEKNLAAAIRTGLGMAWQGH